MAPDISIVFSLGIPRAQTHGLLGIFWLCVPVGLAGLCVFHRAVKRPLIRLLSEPIRRRLAEYATPHWVFPRYRVSAALLSLVLGALTHIAWDTLAHDHTPATRAVPALRTTAFTLLGYPVATYEIVQVASTLLGLAALCLFAAWWLRRPRRVSADVPTPSPLRRRLAVVSVLLSVPTVAGLVAGVIGTAERTGFEVLRSFAGNLARVGAATFLAAVLVFGMVCTVIGESRDAGESPPDTPQ